MIQFPVIPRGAVVTPQLVRTSGDLISTLGGPTQRITRLGSRYAAAVELPSLDAECAGRWLSCPLQAEAEGQTLGLVMPQMLDVSHMIGATGSGAAGSNLVTYVGSAPDPGMWFSFVAGGRHYLHLITAVDGPRHTLKVSPLLRKPLANTPMEFVSPILEGFADETTWSLEYFRFVGHHFTITESA
jgi:hypothetical protein